VSIISFATSILVYRGLPVFFGNQEATTTARYPARFLAKSNSQLAQQNAKDTFLHVTQWVLRVLLALPSSSQKVLKPVPFPNTLFAPRLQEEVSRPHLYNDGFVRSHPASDFSPFHYWKAQRRCNACS
jgi:hypothetical protein